MLRPTLRVAAFVLLLAVAACGADVSAAPLRQQFASAAASRAPLAAAPSSAASPASSADASALPLSGGMLSRAVEQMHSAQTQANEYKKQFIEEKANAFNTLVHESATHTQQAQARSARCDAQ